MTPAQPNPPPPTAPTQSSCELRTQIRSSARAWHCRRDPYGDPLGPKNPAWAPFWAKRSRHDGHNGVCARGLRTSDPTALNLAKAAKPNRHFLRVQHHHCRTASFTQGVLGEFHDAEICMAKIHLMKHLMEDFLMKQHAMNTGSRIWLDFWIVFEGMIYPIYPIYKYREEVFLSSIWSTDQKQSQSSSDWSTDIYSYMLICFIWVHVISMWKSLIEFSSFQELFGHLWSLYVWDISGWQDCC